MLRVGMDVCKVPLADMGQLIGKYSGAISRPAYA